VLTVCVPIYNEVENLGLLYEKVNAVLTKLNREWEIILINDGSTDGSAEILNQLAEKEARIKVIHFRRNYGQTAAMMAGIDYSNGDIIIPMDADLQNDPEDIPRLIAKLDEGFDVCSGWRIKRKDNALRRNLPSRIANWMISKISGVQLHDYGCSLKAYNKDVVKGIKLYGEMHRFIPIYASWHGAKVTEIPVAHHPRRFGQSKYGLERVIKVVLDLAVVKFLDRYAQKPMYIFGGVGMLSLLLSGLAAAWALYLKFFENTSLVQTPLPLMFTFTALTGVICLLMGLLAELVMRTYHESQEKDVYLIKETRNFKQDTRSSRNSLSRNH
jgi:glycosyltransferase involved in cell wall biosynthesis